MPTGCVVNAQSQIEQNGIQEIKYLLDLALKSKKLRSRVITLLEHRNEMHTMAFSSKYVVCNSIDFYSSRQLVSLNGIQETKYLLDLALKSKVEE